MLTDFLLNEQYLDYLYDHFFKVTETTLGISIPLISIKYVLKRFKNSLYISAEKDCT